MEHKQLTKRIIDCANTVYRKLGFGFLESIYELSLMIELNKSGLKAASHVSIDVQYDEQSVGSFCADIVVEETVIIKLTSVAEIRPADETQLINYLAVAEMPVGLILNFSEYGVEVNLLEKNRNRTHLKMR